MCVVLEVASHIDDFVVQMASLELIKYLGYSHYDRQPILIHSLNIHFPSSIESH
jgi:hypothetical protein